MDHRNAVLIVYFCVMGIKWILCILLIQPNLKKYSTILSKKLRIKYLEHDGYLGKYEYGKLLLRSAMSLRNKATLYAYRRAELKLSSEQRKTRL